MERYGAITGNAGSEIVINANMSFIMTLNLFLTNGLFIKPIQFVLILFQAFQ
jgi:hypothetical protein